MVYRNRWYTKKDRGQMDLKELKYEEVMNRLDNLNKIDLDERLSLLEKHMSHFIMVCTEIKERFQFGIKIDVTKNAHEVLTPIKEAVKLINRECNALEKFRRNMEDTIKKQFDDVSITGTLKFMAKQLKELTEEVKKIKEKGIKKSIQLDVTMDGYEMVPKSPKEPDQFKQEEPKPEDAIKKLFETLTDREQKVLIHKYGLFGEKPKTYLAIGKIFHVSGERIGQIYRKAIRKCKHAKRRDLVKNITHLELRYDILDE